MENQSNSIIDILKNKSELYQVLFDLCPDAIFIETLDGKIIDCNDTACNMYGYNKNELVGRAVTDLVPEEIIKILPNVIERELAEGEISIEALGKKRDGEIFPTEVNTRLSVINGENIVIVHIRDISKQKLVEEESKKSEAKYRELADSLPQIIFEFNLEGKITFANLYAFSVFGYTYDEFAQGLSALNMVAPEDRRRAFIDIQNALKGKSVIEEYRLLKKDGTTFSGLIHSIPIVQGKEIIGVRGIIADITERKKYEEILIHQTNLLRQLIDNIPDQIFIKDRKSQFIIANAEILKGFGIKHLDDLIGKTDFDILPYENAKELYDEEQRIMETGVGFTNYEYSFWDSSGAKRWYSSTKLPLRDADGNIIGLVGSNRDITQARKAEESLYDSEEKLRVIFNNVNDAIFIHDENGKIIDVNDTMLRMYRVERDEALNFSILNDYSAYDNPIEKFPDLWREVILGYEQIFDWKAKRPKDGTIFDVEVFLTRLKLRGNVYILATVRDITERKRAENDRLNLQKLESLGLLAGGIAHDFNNLLAVILGNTSMALNNISDETTKNYLINTELAVKQSMGLTKQLLTFAKGGVPIKKISSIDELLKDTTIFCLSGSNVLPEFQINGSWLVNIDQDQISQVIQNIVINAKQAMPNGGKIIVTTENVIDESNSKYLRISIKDFGIGIPESYISRIFDPYFTTKQSGSGLGLSVCYSIIQKHDGKISVESKIGVGTTFHILLPAIDMEILEPKNGKVSDLPELKGNILVMDDEELIRDVLTSMLGFNGHSVSTAKDGDEAIKMYRQAMDSENQFDLVIMDLTIPGGLGGKEAIQEILSINPKAKVIVSSGYSDDPVMSDPRKYGFIDAISKPYDVKELNNLVSSVMKNS